MTSGGFSVIGVVLTSVSVWVAPLSAKMERLDSLYREGNRQFSRQDYEEANYHYTQILREGYEHPDLYYNLGNAYYKNGQIGNSIWAYEKGVKLKPWDKDLKFNLKLANARIMDRVELPEPFFLLQWYDSVKWTFSPIHWSVLFNIFFMFSAFCFFLTRTLGRSAKLTSRRLKLNTKNLLDKFMILSLILSVITLTFLTDLYFELSDKKEGIIIEQESGVYSAPTDLSSLLFVVHEGTKVEITADQSPWLEVELIDGKKGWMRAGALKML